MTTVYIILSVLCGLAILLWVLVLFSNETDKSVDDAFTPVWMTVLFLILPWVSLCLLLKKLHFAEIPLWSTIPIGIIGFFAGILSGYKALKNYLIAKNEFLISEKLKIDSEYKKRFELIPNLVKVIKSFTENENKNIELVMQSREALMKTNSENSRKKLDQSVNLLVHSSYDYPALQNMPLYRNLNASLISTQENIAYYTSVYNAKAADFNKDIKQFPATLFLRNLNLQPVKYLDDDIKDEMKDSTTLLNNL